MLEDYAAEGGEGDRGPDPGQLGALAGQAGVTLAGIARIG
jgi:hypothetical protein